MPSDNPTSHPDDKLRPVIPPVHAGPGQVEIGAVGGQVVLYIGVLDHHVAFSPEQAVEFATIILEKAKAAMAQVATGDATEKPNDAQP